MCKPRGVTYTLACGHYFIAKENACPQAKPDLAGFPYVSTMLPCDALIYELEMQRKDGWGWTCKINGETIHVSMSSSGHCDHWREPGYKKPDYLKLLKSTMPNTGLTSPETNSSTASTTSGTEGKSTESASSAITNEELKPDSNTKKKGRIRLPFGAK